MTQPETKPRTRAEMIRDLIMLGVIVIWLTFGVLSVYQIFRDGSKVLDSLPPFWFWGIPLAPFSALYAPWGTAVSAMRGQPLPQPEPPEPPAAPQPESGQ